MTIALWCVLAGILLPYVWTIAAKLQGRFAVRDNRNPREFLEHLAGPAKRAHWAQQNSFEALPGFIAAVLVAQHLHAAQHSIDLLALTWVAMRVLHGVFYIANMATLRSTVWFVGVACVVALFVIAV